MSVYQPHIAHLKLSIEALKAEVAQLKGDPKKEGLVSLKQAQIKSHEETIKVMKKAQSFGGIDNLVRESIGNNATQESLF